MKEYTKGRLDLANDLGEQLDKLAELSEQEVYQRAGQASGLREGAEKVRLLHAHVDKDFEEDKLKGVSDLEGVATVKLYITRATEILLNLSEKAKAEHLVANGKAAQAKQAVEVVQRYARAAKVTLEQSYASEAEAAKLKEDGAMRPSRGGRESVADRRARPAKAKAKKKVK